MPWASWSPTKRDARALLAVGKTATQRGFPLDAARLPDIGVPAFEPVGDRIEKAMVYAIARQESAFDPAAQSSAGARGLMQLMPATARRTAKRVRRRASTSTGCSTQPTMRSSARRILAS